MASLEHWNLRPYRHEDNFLGPFTLKTRHMAHLAFTRYGHAVCILWVHPPTSHYPTLSTHTEPISQEVTSQVGLADIGG